MTTRLLAVSLCMFALAWGLGARADDEDAASIGIDRTTTGYAIKLDRRFKVQPETITVTGTGKVAAVPDLAEINVGVVTQAATAREALKANNEAMQALQDTLKERGVAAKDIQTSNLNIQPQYSQPPRPVPGQPRDREFAPKIVAYQVTNTVHIKARDLGKLGVLLDAVVQAGANQMHGIAFRIDEPEKLLDQARKRAMADAKRKAELLAGEAGVVLGPPISIREAEATPPPRPMFLGMQRAAAAEAVPVAAGEQELSVDISVVYELKRPR
ncbi:MAG: SIMPL domain-containing protein [Isosphaeraceae bacterium]|nr:SIMPL domain-containing protein [Isosphaeraceae bacterium]